MQCTCSLPCGGRGVRTWSVSTTATRQSARCPSTSSVAVNRNPLSPSSSLPLHRAQVGDLVAEANGQTLLGCSQQEASQRINEPGKSIRLKLGRSLVAVSNLSAPVPGVEDLTVVGGSVGGGCWAMGVGVVWPW